MTDQQAATDYVDLAFDLIEAGYPIFPARSVFEDDEHPEKSPYVDRWEQRATRNPDVIERWWTRWPTAIPAVPPGRVGCAVVDLDVHQDRPSGFDTAMLAGFATEASVTGTSFSGYGKHLWFKGTAPSNNGIYDGIDRKSTGGYVVVPYRLPPVSSITDQLPGYYAGAPASVQANVTGTDINVREWLTQHGGKIGAPCQAILDRLPVPFTGHEELLRATRTLVGYGAKGLQGASTALVELGKLWMAAEHLSGDPEDELDKAIIGAIRKFGVEDAEVDLSGILSLGDEGVALPGAISLDDLLSKQFPEPQWVVPGIIPEGTTLLVANPKIGKSWMMLDLAVHAALGEPMLGAHTSKTKWRTLYLALEDHEASLAGRLRMIGARASKNVQFITKLAAKDDVLEILKAFYLGAADKPSLVILDTLGRAMPAELEGSIYRAEYDFTAELKNVVPEGSALVIVHHTNKNKRSDDEDYLRSVSGTQGIAGAVDTVLMLSRPRFEADGSLLITSRFGIERELDGRFEAGKWTFPTDKITLDNLVQDTTTKKEVPNDTRAALGLE